MSPRERARGPEQASTGRRLEAVGTEDHAAWADAVARSFQYDFHHLPGYHRIAEHRGEGHAQLFVYRDGQYVIALPLLLRPVLAADPTGVQDATSVYGYAGPVASHGRIPHGVVLGFHEALSDELSRRRVVAVFSRLHPLIEQRHLLTGLGECPADGLTVSVDLTRPLEDQWADYSKSCRRIIRRAQEAGLVGIHDRERTYRSEWATMYHDTMQRVGAPLSYRFDEEYFEMLAAELGPALHLFVAAADGRPVAGGLYTICDGIVQAHLGAMRQDYARLSPTRLVDDTARRWAHDAGAKVFHLGGGVGGQQDSLFQYKAGFSNRRHEFRTWRWIVDDGAYRDLCGRGDERVLREADREHEVDYFPAYRRPGMVPPLTEVAPHRAANQ